MAKKIIPVSVAVIASMFSTLPAAAGLFPCGLFGPWGLFGPCGLFGPYGLFGPWGLFGPCGLFGPGPFGW